MVPISFRAIALGLLFVLQGLGDPFTHAHQGKNLNANSVAATRAEKSSVFRGRKVVVDRGMREEVKKAEQDRQNTEISGATHSTAGKWDEGKGINLEVNQSNGNRKFPMTSFVALSADYHDPRSHPPKHN